MRDLFATSTAGAYRRAVGGWYYNENTGWKRVLAIYVAETGDPDGTGVRTVWKHVKDLAPPNATPPTPVASAAANWQFSASWAYPAEDLRLRCEVWSADMGYATMVLCGSRAQGFPWPLYLPEWGERNVHARLAYYNEAGAGPFSAWSNVVTLTSGQAT